MTADIVISRVSALHPDLADLIAELDVAIREMEPETPQDFNFCLTAEEMDGPDTTVWIARTNDRAVGCCALLRHPDGAAELKRMFVRPEARGARLGARLLDTVEAQARLEGSRRLLLETGVHYRSARRLYEAAGFEQTGAFADYPDNPYSIFYAKPLT
ncbi:GNAT family N-acetyltransferase [Aureimonas sp. ME7]|uniref:GNAT family N-acetyltransferase n=1 Tax=Aureimonas sp. ME7 TaxID=2744252 RepID=UPI0015F52D7F|nr:GNAT family N-acetyltransferase [Aureimonas sp. ME7]